MPKGPAELLRRSLRARSALVAGLAFLAGLLGACDSSQGSPASPTSTTSPGVATGTGIDASVTQPEDDGGLDASDEPLAPPCLPFATCNPSLDCPDGGRTEVVGTVFDPAGTTPIYNAAVYVPASLPLPPLTPGVTECNTCAVPIGNYAAVALSDVDGSFRLEDVPAGVDVPLVVQVGKWRRVTVIPSVRACATTTVAADSSRLPRSGAEGDLPQMAVLTGACDGIACTLRRMGVEASEFTGPSGPGHVHVYRGVGGPDLADGGAPAGDCSGASGACPLWSTVQGLQRYDDVFLGCECGANEQTKPDKTAMHDWLGLGGTVFAIHDQETWFQNGPSDFRDVAIWAPGDAGVLVDAGDDGGLALASPGPFAIDTSDRHGADFARWAGYAGVLAADGVALNPADVSLGMLGAEADSRRWIYEDNEAGVAPVQLLSFSTPVGGIAFDPPTPSLPPQYCGRAVLSDVHVGALPTGPSTDPVPDSCAIGPLSPEEKALEFQIFDLSVCVSDEDMPPHL